MRINFQEGKKVNVFLDNFIIKTDQKIEYGGDNENPEPFSLFIASIGACTGFYVLSFCQKRNISTEDITLFLKTKKNKLNNLIEEINIDIKTSKLFPDKYIKPVIKAANLCSVKRQLDDPPKINISLQKSN